MKKLDYTKLGRLLRIDWREDRPRAVRLAGDRLVLGGPRDTVGPRILRWLRAEAQATLTTETQAFAEKAGVTVERVAVGDPRSRWGSCSAKGVISLNARLLFLPPELARYVMAHELVHTRHLNHSAQYWECLEALFPGARVLDSQLRQAGRHAPGWSGP